MSDRSRRKGRGGKDAKGGAKGEDQGPAAAGEAEGAGAEGAQAAENPQAAQGPAGDAGQGPKGDEAAEAEVQEAAEAVDSPDGGGDGGGSQADAPAATDQDAQPAAEKAAKEAEGSSSDSSEEEAGPDADEPAAEAADDTAGDDTAGDETADEAAEPEQETLHGQPLVDSLGQAVVHTDREGYLELCQALRADGYDLMVGVTGVDYLVHPGRQLPPGVSPERFEVVVELASISTRRRIRVRCQVPGSDPVVPSLFDVWPGSEAHERETYDMYGVVFEGHPDPSRILMPEDWEGHPLRKDYATGRIPVQFKESPGGR